MYIRNFIDLINNKFKMLQDAHFNILKTFESMTFQDDTNKCKFNIIKMKTREKVSSVIQNEYKNLRQAIKKG